MNVNISRLLIAVIFVVSFTTIGWLAPALYATYTPPETYIEEDTFYAPDTTVDATQHEVCFTRYIKPSVAGNVIMEMYLVPEDGPPIRIQAEQEPQYFQEGNMQEIITVDLPQDIAAGNYHYKRIYQMELVNSRVVRTFEFNSNTFYIHGTGERPMHCG